jgi:hypothetical protein
MLEYNTKEEACTVACVRHIFHYHAQKQLDRMVIYVLV